MVTVGTTSWPGRSAEHHIDFVFIVLEIVFSHVPFENYPVANVVNTTKLVATKCLARIPIPVENSGVFETSSGCSECKTTCSDEGF